MGEPGEPELRRWLTVGSMIAAARKRLGLSKRAAAQKAGISESQWRHLEAGQRVVYGNPVVPNPRDETLVAIAHAVDLRIADLFREAGRDWPEEQPGAAGERYDAFGLHTKLDRLSPAKRAAVEAIVDELLEGER